MKGKNETQNPRIICNLRRIRLAALRCTADLDASGRSRIAIACRIARRSERPRELDLRPL